MKFSTKIFIYFFTSVSIILLGIFLLTRFWLTDYHVKDGIEHEKQLAAITVLKVEEYILHNDLVALFNLMQSIVKTDHYVDYIYVQRNSEILAHTFGRGVPADLLKLPSLPANLNYDITPIEDYDGHVFYCLRTAVPNPPGSTLNLIVSERKMLASLNPHRNLMLIVSILFLAVFPSVLAIFLSRLVSKPINDLRMGVERIGSGDLGYRLEIQGEKEISNLFKDINIMAENLERMKEEMEDEINERIQTENEMEQQTVLLNNILNNVPYKIFWKNRDLVYIGCNQSFAEAAGYSYSDEVIGKTDKDLPWTEEETGQFVKSDKKIIKKGCSLLDLEELITESDGNRKNIITSKVPLKDNKGKVYGILGIYYDITKRKQVEEALKQTQKMEAIGTLAGGIAHDFNNILNGIIGYTELALDESNKNNIKEFLKEALTFGLRAKDLVKQILTFSRKDNEERKPLLLSGIIEDELKLLHSMLPSTIEIRTDIRDKEGMVLANSTQIQQIILNLCTNAAHAMEEHGGILDISLKAAYISKSLAKKFSNIIPGKYLQLQISDTGTGIDPGIVHRIFEPFYTTKESGKGTGMGLALVHSIVKECHGEVTVNSHPGEGTTFTLLFPRAETVVLEENDIHVFSVPTGNERVLFVDDEKMLLKLGEKIITSLGYNVKSINSSLEALEIFRESPDEFDLIITDLTMPHMTGYNLSKEILLINPEARIILCTGYSDNINPEKVKAARIKALLYKPLRKKDLAVMIRRVLDN